MSTSTTATTTVDSTGPDHEADERDDAQRTGTARTEHREQDDPDDEWVDDTKSVDYWKKRARLNEKAAKDNESAAAELKKLKDAKKSTEERMAEELADAKREVETIPEKVADALREHLVKLHKISSDDAELYLTATDPDRLVKQVNGLVQRSGSGQRPGYVASQGTGNGKARVSPRELGRQRAEQRYQKQSTN